MSLPRPIRVVLLLALGLALAGVYGCGKDEEVIPPPPDMPVEDSDDIAQQIAAMIASDNGGWFFTVQTMAESLSVPIPPTANLGAGRSNALVLSAVRGGRFKTLNQFTRTQAGVTHNWRLGYFDNDGQQHAGRDSAVEYLEAGVTASGTLNANGLSGGTYGMFADSSQYTVDFIAPESDTIHFDVFFEDSSYALVTSSLRANSQRLWFQQNLVSTTDNLLVRASTLPSPYPFAGSIEIQITAQIMGASGARDDVQVEWLAEGRMEFDGTDTATLTISVIAGLSPDRAYRVNLKTGAIAKL